tara:strand:- start:63 stop:305 length:243 start_codon:yes stop_codon:yes gene_type:complete
MLKNQPSQRDELKAQHSLKPTKSQLQKVIDKKDNEIKNKLIHPKHVFSKTPKNSPKKGSSKFRKPMLDNVVKKSPIEDLL